MSNSKSKAFRALYGDSVELRCTAQKTLHQSDFVNHVTVCLLFSLVLHEGRMNPICTYLSSHIFFGITCQNPYYPEVWRATQQQSETHQLVRISSRWTWWKPPLKGRTKIICGFFWATFPPVSPRACICVSESHCILKQIFFSRTFQSFVKVSYTLYMESPSHEDYSILASHR